MIYVTIGTMYMGFPRLVMKMDAIAAATGERVVIQTGLDAVLPTQAESFAFKPHEEVLAIQREARVIVCHAGIGCVRDALDARKPFIVVPRLRRYKEHMNDHQLDLAEMVERRGWGRMVMDVDELDALCAHPPAPATDYMPDQARLIQDLRISIEDVALRRNRK